MATTTKKLASPPKKAQTLTSLSNLFSSLDKSPPEAGFVNVYRGHADLDFALKPSLFRKREYRRDEKNIWRELISAQPQEFREDNTVFEKLVRMQHYSLPTRLLDITFNPLVALYFACANNFDKDGEFITFSVRKRSIKYFDSDTVSCVANLSNLTGRQRDEIRGMHSSELLNSSDTGSRLLNFIKSEKPYFLPKIDISDLRKVFVVKPKQTNQRILAQQGAFFLFGLKTELPDRNDLGIKIKRTRVPSNTKQALLMELDRININASTLFPEVESAAKYIMSKLTPASEEFEKLD